MRTKIAFKLVWVSFAAFILPHALLAGIQIEEAQRELQARYYFCSAIYTGGIANYAAWPYCNCCTPPPDYPKNGYYGDLDKNPALAVQLVQNLSSNFYNGYYASFVNTPDGRSNVEGQSWSTIPYYAKTNFPTLIDGVDITYTTNITVTNYSDVFACIYKYILMLQWVNDPAWIGGTGLSYPYDGGYGGGAAGTCAAAIAAAGSAFAYNGYNGNYYEDYINVNTYAQYISPGNYQASAASCRGTIEEELDYSCSFNVFLTLIANANGVGSTPTPVTVDGLYHYFASSAITNWGLYVSAPVNNINPTIVCGDNNAGWWTDDYEPDQIFPLLIIKPVWDTSADDVSCGVAGCSHGCSESAQMAGSVSEQTTGQDSSGSMDVLMSLGTETNNMPAGYLYLNATAPSAALYTPAALNYSFGPNVSGSPADGWIATANVTATFAITTNGYAIMFTNNQDNQFVSSVSIASNGLDTNQMIVTETIGSGGTPRVMQFNYTAATTNWTLVEGGGLSYQSRSSAWVTPTNRTDTIVVSNASGSVVTQTTETYQTFPWGSSLIQQTVGAGSAAKTTAWNYYPPGSGSNNYAQVASMVDPTGRWTWYQYDFAGRLTNEVTPLGDNLTTTNAGSNRQIETVFDDATATITTIQLLAGTEVGRSYQINSIDGNNVEEIQTITCTVAGAAVGDSSNLTNITWRTTVASGSLNPWDTMTNLNADGTMSLYSYANLTVTGGLTGRSVTVKTGAPGSGGTSIADGTETTTTYGAWGELLTNQVTDIASGLVLSLDSYDYGSDPLHRSYTVTHNDGTTESVSYACCGLDTATDRDGVTTQYYYDDAKRQVATARLGIMTTNVLDAAGNTVQTIRIGTNGSPISLSGMAYDDSGTLVYETNALNGVTTHTQTTNSAGETIYTVTNPDGGTVVTTNYLDGMTGGVGGTAANWSRLVQGADGGGAFTYAIKVNASGGTNEWTKSYTDVGGRASGTAYPDGSYSTNYYNALGQMTKSVDQDGVTALYQYNPNAKQVFTAVGSDGSITLNGSDRLTYVTNDVTTDHSTGVRRSRTYVFPTVSSSTSNLFSMTETSTNGLTTWQTRYGPSTVTSQSVTVYNGSYRTNTATAENGSSVVTVYLNGIRQSVTMKDANGSQVGQTTYTYDAQGRVTTETDARNGTTSYAYNNADQVDSVTTPPPGGSGSGLTTLTYFNAMLQPTNVVYPDSTSVTTVYTLDGQVAQTSGSRTYPVGYSYDPQGRPLTMTNWTGGVGSGAELTTWKYDGQRGWLTNKQDNSGYGPSYTYTSAGRLASRAWARGTNTSYTYNAAGDLATVGYNDGTPGLTNGYDRLGRRTSVICGPIETIFGYDTANDYIGEGYIGGILNGIFVTNGYDGLLRRYNNSIVSSGTVIARTTNSYDPVGRVAVVSDQTNTAAYFYVANSPLVDHIVFAHSGSAVMTNQNTYDYVNRLTGKTSVSAVLSYNYQYNTANQRTKVTLVDGSYWLYSYDSLGQLTSGVKYFYDGTPYPGQQFGYDFDTIGNRTTTSAGGDASGANLRSTTYTNNALNQVTSRNVPGFVDVMGLTLATNVVQVNGTNATQKWEYYREQMATNNTSAAQWVGITVTAPGQSTVTGGAFVAQNPETFGYDLDGNTTNDGRWTYTWDAENRLVNMTSLASAPTASKFSLTFTYDYTGRRIQKLVSTNNGSGYVGAYTNIYLYDGWNPIAMLTPSGTLLASFIWGTDLSGTMQGAGGVGGLLMENLAGIGPQFPAYDGNGNVTALVSATNWAMTANYEYGPFGELIRATGPMAKLNPFRFSTKYQDDETDFLYYGYRYYNPSTGRWLSRDPAGEDVGGPNLYGMVGNDPVDNIDVDGLLTGHVSIDYWKPIVTDSFLSHSRGWLFGVSWTPPTDGAWANPCACKPCQKVIWEQSAKFGKAGTFHIEIDESNYSKYGYAWDCTANSSKAALFDQPDQHGAFVSLFRSPYTFEARSMAKCVAGADAGKIYAVVAWGFDWKYDTTPTGIGPVIVGQ